ncbi:MAG: SOS response-associated peptidase [Bacteroidales bacterium]
MCGRFSFSPLAKIIEDRFDVKVDSHYKPRFNSAPSQNLAVISNTNPGHLSYFRWGLIPFWAKDAKIGNKMINAKAETITEKPSFRNSFKRKRCLVPSDGFFEWKKIGAKEKIPYRILMKDQPFFRWQEFGIPGRTKREDLINSFTILTTAPNELMAEIHHRMPQFLEKMKRCGLTIPIRFAIKFVKPFPI